MKKLFVLAVLGLGSMSGAVGFHNPFEFRSWDAEVGVRNDEFSFQDISVYGTLKANSLLADFGDTYIWTVPSVGVSPINGNVFGQIEVQWDAPNITAFFSARREYWDQFKSHNDLYRLGLRFGGKL